MRSESAGGIGDEVRRFGELLEPLLDIRSDMLAREAQLWPLIEPVPAPNRPSARNLIHYLALRSHDLSGLQEVLSAVGLSSLGRAESHALANLEAVISLLARLIDGAQVEAVDAPLGGAEGQALTRGRTRALFGDNADPRPSSIMITMPRQAATDYPLVRSLLQSGMNCMRINCAHDDRAAWEGMLANLRRAQEDTGRTCRVMMDIPGPRVRTGAVRAGPHAVKLRPSRDALGWVVAPAEVVLAAESRGGTTETGEKVLHVDDSFVDALCVGDRVRFRDARGARRVMTVVSAEDGTRRCRLEKTAYLAVGTRLTARLFTPRGRRGVLGGLVKRIPEEPPAIRLSAGDRLRLTSSQEPGHEARRDGYGRVLEPATIPFAPPEALRWIKEGEQIWFDDGKIGGAIRSVDQECAVVEITTARPSGDRLTAERGINLPDSELRFPSLTEEDLQDLPFIAANADLIGYSFVRTADDVVTLQDRLREIGAEHLGIVLKIETRQGYENLPHILLVALRSPAAGVMIARGDLAVECGFTRLAEVQEEILWLCEAAHLPVVWATEVLERLAKSGTATRAEVTDAAMSERAECVMLNKGDFIVEAVHALDSIVTRMQRHQQKKRSLMGPLGIASRFFGAATDQGPTPGGVSSGPRR